MSLEGRKDFYYEKVLEFDFSSGAFGAFVYIVQLAEKSEDS